MEHSISIKYESDEESENNDFEIDSSKFKEIIKQYKS